MATKEPERWITVHGNRIPIFAGQTETEAMFDFIEKQKNKEADNKEKQIDQNKKEADKLNKQEETKKDNPNKVVNTLDEKKLGSTYNNLSPRDKATIRGLTALKQSEIDRLIEYKGKLNSSQAIKIGDKKYNCIIDYKDGKLVYTLKQGNKIIVKQGEQEKVLNQLALVASRR